MTTAAVSAIPQHGGHDDPYKLPPRPFHYAYGVKDSYAGTDFDKKESQDKAGNVEGQYRVALPDGRTQIITYHARCHTLISTCKRSSSHQHLQRVRDLGAG